MRRFLAAWLIAAVAAAPSAALAQSSTLTLIVGGEAYEGPPRFAVSFDGHPLGESTVDVAIDTGSEGRFIDAAVKSGHVQQFDFAIPDDLFSANGEVRLRLTNEASGGPGSVHDRNLYFVSVSINGAEVPATTWATMSDAGLEPSAIFEEYFVLFDGSREAVAAAPAAGWPPASAADEAQFAAAPAEVTPVAAPPAVVETVAQPAEPLAEPSAETEAPAVAPEADTVPAAVAVPNPSETAVPTATAVETAAVASSPTPGPCDLNEIYNVVGFNENSNDLTPRLMERLDQVLNDIGRRECKVQVVGYSSTQGDHATNALFAVERAQNVLRYLREQGLLMAKASATGAGATEQFGADFSANRRVVITVTP